MNIFEKATKENYLFESPKGKLTVIDLWNIDLESNRGLPNLNDIGLALEAKIQAGGKRSLVTGTSAANAALEIQLEIVKHIIAVRLAEKADAENKVARREQARQIDDLIAKKKGEQMENLSLEELLAMRKGLAG